jgi:hypothetical protein
LPAALREQKAASPGRFLHFKVQTMLPSQSRRASAGVRTTIRPDASLGRPLAQKNKRQRSRNLFQSPKRYGEYRPVMPDRSGSSIPILVGSAIIAAAILLSTLITAVGTRFIGMDSPNDDNVWLIDRLTGSVYKCQAADRGKASCEPESATGSIGLPPKH